MEPRLDIKIYIYTYIYIYIYKKKKAVLRLFRAESSSTGSLEREASHFFGLAIGFVVVAGGFAVSHVSGALLNPAAAIALAMRPEFQKKNKVPQQCPSLSFFWGGFPY